MKVGEKRGFGVTTQENLFAAPDFDWESYLRWGLALLDIPSYRVNIIYLVVHIYSVYLPTTTYVGQRGKLGSEER